MKKIIFACLVVFLIAGYAYGEIKGQQYYIPRPTDNNSKLPLAKDIITCEFVAMTAYTYSNDNFLYRSFKGEQTHTITFIGLDTGVPKAKDVQGSSVEAWGQVFNLDNS